MKSVRSLFAVDIFHPAIGCDLLDAFGDQHSQGFRVCSPLGNERARHVVVVGEDTAGDKRLVAYLVGRQGESLDAAEIRKYLRQKLPEYMIPSAFVLLSELPLTPNGKVDRNALPAPDRDRPELGNVYQAPRIPVEETIASIWCELLKLPKVGIYDNFFELGGHSLLATQVISRLRSVFNQEIPLRALFESPTIEQLASHILVQQSQSLEGQAVLPAALGSNTRMGGT